MPATDKKLSKREQKAQAFRNKSKKRKVDDGPADVPETDGIVDEEMEDVEDVLKPERTKPTGKKKSHLGKKKAVVEEEEEEEEKIAEGEETKGTKKRKRSGKKAVTESANGEEVKDEKKKIAPRFIVFVGVYILFIEAGLILYINVLTTSSSRYAGNLPFDVSKEELEKHFESTGGVMSVRMMTDKVTKKPKGFSFIEFDNSESMKRALFFHHTLFKKRQINVELTAGGGGNSETRVQKLRVKNEKLQEERIHEQSIVPAKAALAASSYARAKDDTDNPNVSSERARAARPAAKAEPVRRVKRAASGVNAIRSSVQRSWAEEIMRLAKGVIMAD
ncbi:hypothetical protein BC937DRAFT_94294 [Endogone sp. FLAS-F59071]|nr:hypothetical protein BC937DRAFT_94294 [Endogone sp. FLAS-F59071]|eukprot:RUS14129.1 hypothetical protein BC937DRAFT_94294 [Endogone sp. FLAS-F59071]